MSAAAELQAAVVAALTSATGIAGVVSGVFDAAPARAAFPYLVLGEGTTFDWSHKTGRGREHRLALTIWDKGGRATRLHALAGAAEAALEGLGPDLPSHRIASIVFLRTRIVRDPAGPWAALVEYRARTFEN